MPCVICFKEHSLMRCSKCKLAGYCSKEHQMLDWAEHKKWCIPKEDVERANIRFIESALLFIWMQMVEANLTNACWPVSLLMSEALTMKNVDHEIKIGYITDNNAAMCGRHIWIEIDGEILETSREIRMFGIKKYHYTPIVPFITCPGPNFETGDSCEHDFPFGKHMYRIPRFDEGTNEMRELEEGIQFYLQKEKELEHKWAVFQAFMEIIKKRNVWMFIRMAFLKMMEDVD